MLINCPECGKEISDKCGNCPNCGFPIEVQEILYEYEGKEYNIKPIIDSINSDDGFCETFPIIFQIVGKEFNAHNMYDDIIRKYSPNNIQKSILYDYTSEQSESNQPKCPTCGSTNIEKISATKKVFGGVMFGIFSSDVRNSMHCKNCETKW